MANQGAIVASGSLATPGGAQGPPGSQGPSGSGDMTRAVYDQNANSIVDAAESVPWTGVSGKPATFPPDATAELVARKGQVNGYASLDGTGKVPVAQLPSTTAGPVDLKSQTVTQSGANLSINRTLGENCILSLTASITTVTITNWPASGNTGKVRLIVLNTGAFAISGWPVGTIWPGGTAPTITSGSGKKDIILLMSDDAGTTIYGSVVGQDYR